MDCSPRDAEFFRRFGDSEGLWRCFLGSHARWYHPSLLSLNKISQLRDCSIAIQRKSLKLNQQTNSSQVYLSKSLVPLKLQLLTLDHAVVAITTAPAVEKSTSVVAKLTQFCLTLATSRRNIAT